MPKLCVISAGGVDAERDVLAVASPVSVSVVPLTVGVTAALAAAGSAKAATPAAIASAAMREERFGFSASCQRRRRQPAQARRGSPARPSCRRAARPGAALTSAPRGDRGAHRRRPRARSRAGSRRRSGRPEITSLRYSGRGVLERDHLVVGRGRSKRPIEVELDADDLEDRDRHDARVGLRRRRRRCRPRPRPGRPRSATGRAAGRSNSATSPAAKIVRVVGAHAVVDEHAAVDPQPRLAGELDVGLDARGDEQDVRRRCVRPSAEVDAAQAAVGVDRLGLGLDARSPGRGLRGSCAGSRPRGRRAGACSRRSRALEHGGLQAELVQRVGRLEAEQAAAGDDAALRAAWRWANARSADRVVGRAQHAGPGRRRSPRSAGTKLREPVARISRS